MKTYSISYLAAFVAFSTAVVTANTASATQFSGSIDFGATGVTTDNPILPGASDFSLTGAYTTAATGEYATLGVGNMTPVLFNGFKFNPAVASVDPLWSFSMGNTVFSFDATSVVANWVPGAGGGQWEISGDGMASITGFDNTPGTWSVDLSEAGNLSVAFDSTAVIQVAQVPILNAPDTTPTAALLGASACALGFCARRKSAA